MLSYLRHNGSSSVCPSVLGFQFSTIEIQKLAEYLPRGGRRFMVNFIILGTFEACDSVFGYRVPSRLVSFTN